VAQKVMLPCPECGRALNRGRDYCSQACRKAHHARRGPPPAPERVTWPQGLAGRKRRDRPHNAIPVIELCTDINLRDCWRGWCPCGWETPPFVEIEMAQVECWQHAFADRISDLRVSKNGVSSNGHRTP
jgi:hypothetical protein